MRAVAGAAVVILRVYRRIVSPFLPPACRFSPTCSEYACAVLVEFGLARGAWLSVRRLARCHPFHPGGLDPPPVRTSGAAGECAR